MDKLQELIEDMEVPDFRRTDLGWLSRNLGIWNHKHPNFKEAMGLIKELMRNG